VSTSSKRVRNRPATPDCIVALVLISSPRKGHPVTSMRSSLPAGPVLNRRMSLRVTTRQAKILVLVKRIFFYDLLLISDREITCRGLCAFMN
jgi:hypothetical protein